MEPWERPRLREDLELLVDQAGAAPPPGAVDQGVVYDPVQRRLFELDAADLAVLALLDGTRSPREVARQAGRPLDDVLDLLDDLGDMLLLTDPGQEALLQAWRRQFEREDRLLEPALDSGPLGEIDDRAIDPGEELPLHVVDDARHTCLCCGDCCHYAVPVSPEEHRRLAGVAWPEEVVPEGAGGLFHLRSAQQGDRPEVVIATHSDPTRCAFLDEENLCRVHRRLGAPAKPFACRLFPLAYPVVTPDALTVSLTFQCPWIFASYEDGERLAGHQAELRALVAEMEEVYLLPGAIPLQGEATLPRGVYLPWERALLAAPAAPATDPGAFLRSLQQRWAALDRPGAGPVLAAEELAALAAALQRAVRKDRATLADSPETAAGVAWAGQVLAALAQEPEVAWTSPPWADGPAADRFLRRFTRHFVEGKQHLHYPTLWMGLRALALLVLLARHDAGMMAREAGGGMTSLQLLNRALSRWCRLFELRPLRLALVGGVQ